MAYWLRHIFFGGATGRFLLAPDVPAVVVRVVQAAVAEINPEKADKAAHIAQKPWCEYSHAGFLCNVQAGFLSCVANYFVWRKRQLQH